MTDHPWSTWTALAFPATTGALYALVGTPMALLLFFASLPLAVGTFEMHRSEDYGWPEAMDWWGIFAVFTILAGNAFGLAWIPSAGLALIVASGMHLWTDEYDRREKAVAVLVTAIIIGGVIAGDWLGMVAGFAPLGLGMIVREDGDRGHGIFHLLAAVGIPLLYFVAP